MRFNKPLIAYVDSNNIMTFNYNVSDSRSKISLRLKADSYSNNNTINLQSPTNISSKENEIQTKDIANGSK